MTDNIFTLIPKIRAEVGAVRKDQSTQMGAKYSYRSADSVINALVPILNKYGVFTTVEDTEHNINERTVGNKIVTVATLKKRVTFYAPDGSNVSSTVASESSDYADKATGAAQTYAYRYALLQTFTLPTDEDDPDSRYNEKVIDTSTTGSAKVTAPSGPSLKSLQDAVRALVAGEYADDKGTVHDKVDPARIDALGLKFSGKKEGDQSWKRDAAVLGKVIAEVVAK